MQVNNRQSEHSTTSNMINGGGNTGSRRSRLDSTVVFSFDPAKLGSPHLKSPNRLSKEKSEDKGFRVSSDFIIEEEEEESNEEQPTVNMPLVQPVHYSFR